jgi:hypothetical protein
MTRKLSEQDRQAVDLVLDRFTSVAREDGIVAMGDGVAEPHVQSVEKILSVLAEMPATEPSDDLLSKTLRRIEQVHADVQAREIPPYLGPGQLPA